MKTATTIYAVKLLLAVAITGALLVAALTSRTEAEDSAAEAEEWVCRNMVPDELGYPGPGDVVVGKQISEQVRERLRDPEATEIERNVGEAALNAGLLTDGHAVLRGERAWASYAQADGGHTWTVLDWVHDWFTENGHRNPFASSYTLTGRTLRAYDVSGVWIPGWEWTDCKRQ